MRYLQVNCKEGYSVAADALEQYKFTCEGAKGDVGTADSGKYSCGDACPTCLGRFSRSVIISYMMFALTTTITLSNNNNNIISQQCVLQMLALTAELKT